MDGGGPAGIFAPAVSAARGVRFVVDGVLEAAVRAPIKPRRGSPWVPQRQLLRLAATAGWLVVSAGLTGGTIAELVGTLRVPGTIAAFLGLVLASPLLVAPLRPLLAWRIMVVGILVTPLVVAEHRRDAFWPWPVTACVAMLLALILVSSSYRSGVSTGVGLLTTLAAFGFGGVAGMPFWIGYILAGAITAGLVFGNQTGGRQSVQARLDEQRALRRQDLARQAVLEERSRIARELHDVVAHHMTMIAIQAEAAPLKVPDVPPAAAEIFAAINRAAREALAETRTVVGLLRSDDEAASRAPAPGLVLLDDLVENARGAGLTVEPRVVGVPRPLTAAVDVSAYRILQEALSNASRYAPGSLVRLEVGYRPDLLSVTVQNTAGTDGTQPVSSGLADLGGGHGLVGMRERVAMLGGTLTVGPRPDGGFSVAVELPT
jgi:signal transduction histidine kinase